MRRRIGIWGATDEALRLMQLVAGNARVEVTRIFDRDPSGARERARGLGHALAHHVEPLLTDDVAAFFAEPDFDAVVDASGDLASQRPTGVPPSLQVVTPLTARLLWGYGVAPRDRKAELLQALHEVVESVDLTIEAGELFDRMLEIAVGVTGAEGGSLMLLDPRSETLRIRVARGVEPELWQKIRVGLGQGISGRVAAEGRPIHLRGRADSRSFDLVRERVDVESALCVPLIHGGKVLGVLNVHHASRADAFSEDDLHFMEQLARLDAQIIARAQEHEALRSQAARYDAVREVQALLRGPAILSDRLEAFCRFVAERAREGIAHLYVRERDGSFRMAATSLAGGGFGGEYRLEPGQGIDGQALESQQPVVLRQDSGDLAYAALPLIAGRELVGLLSIQTGAEDIAGATPLESWHEIAAAAAEAIARSDRETRMASRAERINAINETSIRMLSSNEPNKVARLATSSAAMILEADHAILRLQDPTTRRYSIRSYYGAAEGPARESLFRLDKAITVDAIRRRAPHLVQDASLDPNLAELAEEFQSILTAPLKRDGQVIGSLSLYDKVAIDRFFVSRFDDEDLQVFGRFVSYVERALDHALSHREAEQHRNFDEETGLPNAAYLEQRLGEEIARAAGRENSLALCVCRLENRDEITSEAGMSQLQRVIRALAEAMRVHLREFDVLTRIDRDDFAVLMPEPGRTPGERVFELARAVADAISKDEALNQPVRVGLAFGYAVHPDDGSERDALLEHARRPRIRMV
ncbi:MAG: GAF domain-containing protein [Deltaproteobacteria bacterium]|jgi:diguanylate cyclase (GGDEF)-like protein|nr:GAF domain-containing protein [Deltaproteobacteria bacterium]MBW2500531.1 GAF domain-containing protein [Deltaproteobacteria bacterium]